MRGGTSPPRPGSGKEMRQIHGAKARRFVNCPRRPVLPQPRGEWDLSTHHSRQQPSRPWLPAVAQFWASLLWRCLAGAGSSEDQSFRTSPEAFLLGSSEQSAPRVKEWPPCIEGLQRASHRARLVTHLISSRPHGALWAAPASLREVGSSQTKRLRMWTQLVPIQIGGAFGD